MLLSSRQLRQLRALPFRDCVLRRTARLYGHDAPRRIADVLNTAAMDDITVTGFVQTVRKQKKIAFAALSDGSSLESLQAVLQPDQADAVSTGTAVSVRGQWKDSPSGKQQAKELRATEVKVLGGNDATSYPIQKKYQTPEFLRTLPHLRPRIPQNALLLRLRSQVVSSLTTFFDERGFVQVHTPIITSSDCEGAGEVFTIEAPRDATEIKSDENSAKSELERPFFKTPKYLTVSSQLHLEALALAVKNVWTLSPTFRAEKSDTARHLSEFYMLEAEMAFVESAGEVMDVIEDMIKFLTSRLADSKLGQELLLGRKSNSPRGATDSLDDTLHSEDLQNRWEKVLHPSWPRITYHEACLQITEAAKSNAAQFDVIPNETSGLDTEHERYIAAAAGQGGPVFVTDYPRSIKPFYMAPSKHRPIEEIGSVPTVACWDLLMPDVCEVVGGSMREHRLEELQRAMAQKGLAVDSQSQAEGEQGMTELNAEGDTYDAGLEWYLDLRRYGSVPHGGWGLGFDRLLGFLAGVSNIRDVVTFPRYHKKCLC